MTTKQRAIENLADIKNILDELRVPFMLDGGTLLGAYRDNDFCVDDWDDIDLTTLAHHEEQLPQIISAAESMGFALYHHWPSSELNTAQIALKRNKIKVDLMFKKTLGNKVWWTVYARHQRIYKSVPIFYVFPFSDEKITFHGMAFGMPARVEDYLAYRYGDWRKPLHRSQYDYRTTDKSIVAGFEEI